MNKLFNQFYYLLIVFCISCTNFQTKSTDQQVIHISFENEIEGYTVTAIWKPTKVFYNHVVGPAIIEFKNKKDSTTFSITNNNFSLLKSKLSFTYSIDSLEIESLNQDFVSLIYDDTNLGSEENFGTTNEPFFFQDLNFDGKKELLITEVRNGQRSVASFKAYSFEYGELAHEMYDITNAEPYRYLDELSKIDDVAKTITIYGSGGLCSNNAEIYKLKVSTTPYERNIYILDYIIEEVRKDELNQCLEYLYKVDQSSKRLVSVREIK